MKNATKINFNTFLTRILNIYTLNPYLRLKWFSNLQKLPTDSLEIFSYGFYGAWEN